MNKAEIIEQVKKMLFGSEMKFAEAKLEDGTSIFTDATNFEAGAEVYTVDEQGNKVPVFDAEHKLEDGTVVVTVGGKITEVKPLENLEDVVEEPKKEDIKEEMVEEVKPEDEKKVEEKMVGEEDLLKKIQELEAKIAELEVAHEEMAKKMLVKEQEMSKVQEATVFLAEEFSKTPAGEKVELKASGYINNFKKDSSTKESRLKELMTLINK